MAFYSVKISKNVRKKDLPALPQNDIAKIVKKIEGLAQNPFPKGAVQLKGRKEWRLRQGDYRILYIVEHEVVTVFVVKVGHRREIYRR